MSLNKIYDYKLWDSLLGIENITWECSTDINFNNIILTNTTTGNKLVDTLPLIVDEHTDIYCRVKINGYNGSTDWFNVIEDKSNIIYLTESENTYGADKNIKKEIILDKTGNEIHTFDFFNNDEVIYLPKYKRILDIDFLSNLKINTDWFYEHILSTTNGDYTDNIYSVMNDYIILPIQNRNNIKVTSNMYYKNSIQLNNTYIEVRLNLLKMVHSYKYISFKDVNGDNVFSITNIDDNITININNTEFIIPVNISDTFYIIGLDTDGKLYFNHKVEAYSGLMLNDIESIHIGNTYTDDVMEGGEFVIDWIRVYEDTLLNDVIVN